MQFFINDSYSSFQNCMYMCVCVFANVYDYKWCHSYDEKNTQVCLKRDWIDNLIFMITNACCMPGPVRGNKRTNKQNTGFVEDGKKQTKFSLGKRILESSSWDIKEMSRRQ